MATRIPERKYIETLIAGGFNSDMIMEDLTAKKINLPTPAKLKELHAEVINSPGYIKGSPTEEWLSDRGIINMYSYRFKHPYADVSTLGIEKAFRMLEDPQMRKFVYTLCMAGLSDEDVELIVNGRYDISYETPDFLIFTQYFSNFSMWGHTDKELYVETVIDPELKKLYKLALKRDRYYLVWKLGLGTDPSISFDGLMRDMLVDSYFIFKEKMRNFPDEAQRFGALAVKLSDRIDKMAEDKKTTSDLLSDLKFKLVVERTDNTDKPTIQDAEILKVELPEKHQTVIPDLTQLVKD